MGQTVRVVALSTPSTDTPMERLMSQVFDASRSLTALEQETTIIGVIEMSQSKWLVAAVVPGIKRQPLKKLDADEESLLKLLHRWRQEAERAGYSIKRIVVAYEAGRDGFWLAGAWHGGLRHPSHEHCGVARASTRKDRSPRYGAAVARLARLAARREASLQHGRDPNG